MTYSNEELLKMYEGMLLSRIYEETAIKYLKKGALTHGTWHLSYGEEATQIGSVAALKEGDFYAPTHRSHGVLTYLLDLNELTAEGICKITGNQRGKSSSVHIGNFEKGVLNANGVLGSNSGIAVGYAMGLKRLGKEGAVLSTIGDSASCEGNFYEALNLAGATEAPVVFFIENNGVGMTNPIEKSTKCVNLSEKAAGAGIPGVTVDGNDIIAVREAVEEALNMAREGQPSVVEAKCCRFSVHSFGLAVDGRDPKIVEEAEKHDPIELFETKLRSINVLDDEKKNVIINNINERCTAAFEYAIACNDPTKESTLDLDLVYANRLDSLD